MEVIRKFFSYIQNSRLFEINSAKETTNILIDPHVVASYVGDGVWFQQGLPSW